MRVYSGACYSHNAERQKTIADETSEKSADHVKSYGQTPGYTRATLEISNKRQEFLEQIFKNFRSSDCYLQLESMKKESLVIANQLCCGE